MVVAIALWSLEVKPTEPQAFRVPNDLRITNIALGDDVKEENGRTSVKLTYKAPKPSDSDEEEEEEEDQDEGEPTTTVLCSLTPGKIEHALVDLILEEDQEIVFEVVGKNTVYLTGNYVDQTPPGHEHDEDVDSDLGEGDPYGLEDGTSDIEIDEEEDDSIRFEEIVEEEEEEEAASKPESKKRARNSDATEVDESKLSKTQKKKLNKKLKAENGEAVPTGEEKQAEKGKEKEQQKEKKEKAKKEGNEEAKAKKHDVKELAGGVKIEDHKVGTGPQAKNGDWVSMRYVGKLQNGKQFDANTKGKPFKFRLGKGEVIKGWDIGVAGMQVGGERRLIIPPAMGYGKKASGPIPANSILNFEVKLVGIN